MGAIADALVNAGLKQAQALIIEKGLGANGARPSVAEFQEALVRAGVDHHSASILASTILSSVPGDGISAFDTGAVSKGPVGPVHRWDAGGSFGMSTGVDASEITTMPGLPSMSALRVKPNGAATVRFTLTTPIDLSAVTHLYLPIMVRDNGPTSGTASVYLFLASDSGIANRVRYTLPLRGRAPGEIVPVSLDLKTAAASAVAGSQTDGQDSGQAVGTINWTAVNTIQILIQTPASGVSSDTNEFYIGDLHTDAPQAAGMMLGFDRPFVGVLTHALPILRDYGIVPTLYVVAHQLGMLVDGGQNATLAQIQAADRAGCKISLHSYSKFLDTTNATLFPTAQSITDEIVAADAWGKERFENWIGREHPCIAVGAPWDSPATYAAGQRALQGYMGAGVKTLRAGNEIYSLLRLNHMLPGVRRPTVIGTTPLNAATNDVDVAAKLEAACTRRALVSFYAHDVVASGASGAATNKATIQALAEAFATRRAAGRIAGTTADRLA